MCWKKFDHKGRTNSLICASGGEGTGCKISLSLITHAKMRWSRVQKDETTLPSLLQSSSFNHGAERRGLAHTKARMRIKHPWEKTLARKRSYTERVEEAGGWVISPSTGANKTRQRLLPVTRHDCHQGTAFRKSESKTGAFQPEQIPTWSSALTIRSNWFNNPDQTVIKEKKINNSGCPNPILILVQYEPRNKHWIILHMI